MNGKTVHFPGLMHVIYLHHQRRLVILCMGITVMYAQSKHGFPCNYRVFLRRTVTHVHEKSSTNKKQTSNLQRCILHGRERKYRLVLSVRLELHSLSIWLLFAFRIAICFKMPFLRSDPVVVSERPLGSEDRLLRTKGSVERSDSIT